MTSTKPLTPREEILETAIAYIDAHGIDALSMRKLGAVLGKDPTAFYRHYRGKRDLIAAIADRLLTGALADFTASESWKETIRDLMRRVRAVYLQHARFSRELAYSPEMLLGNARVHEQVLSALSRSGVPSTEVPRFAVLVSRWAISVNTFDAVISGEGAERTRQAQSQAAFSELPPVDFPLATRYALELFPNAEDSFAAGLELILDEVSRCAALMPTSEEISP